ncbi:MAG: hypothetical protein IIX84_00845, partial [Oscillospiraceae bacterium]|nr:hypothetical protein [Oscillospiraceae bacterium]
LAVFDGEQVFVSEAREEKTEIKEEIENKPETAPKEEKHVLTWERPSVSRPVPRPVPVIAYEGVQVKTEPVKIDVEKTEEPKDLPAEVKTETTRVFSIMRGVPVSSSPVISDGVLKDGSLFERDEEINEEVHKNDNISAPCCDIIKASEHENYQLIGELFGVYIVVSRNDEMILIDKHAAHERIRYNALLSGAGGASSQGFLDPPVVALDADDKALLLESSREALEVGFEIDDFGGTSVILRAVPEEYVGADPTDALTELAACLKSGVRTTADRRDRIMKMVACKTAVRSGDKSDKRELEAIADRVFSDPTVRTCPHGRPVMISMTKSEIEKRFSRIV